MTQPGPSEASESASGAEDIEALKDQIQILLKENAKKQAEIDRLTMELERLLKALRGHRSEKLDPNQLLLVLEGVEGAPPEAPSEAPPEPEPEPVPVRKRRKGHGRAAGTERLHYDWGLDLSLTLQGAGGVGGLLRQHHYVGSTTNTHRLLYDANGNVGQLIDKDNALSAMYEYDGFARLIRMTSAFAATKLYRFSTKYFDGETQLSSYGYHY